MAKTKTSTDTKKKKVVKKSAPKTAPAKRTVKPATKTRKEPKLIQEENSYGRTIVAAILIIVICIGGYFAVQHSKAKNADSNYVQTADEKQFKDEYEGLNNANSNMKKVEIPRRNYIKYISMKEAYKILDSGSGIIYFGFSGSPQSRYAAPSLIEAVSKTDVDTIYYVDIRPYNKKENDLRDLYELDERNKAKKVKDADSDYYNILLALANNLEEYTLETDSGKKVSTGEKRLYAPTVVAVKDGKLLDFHQGTVDNHEINDKNELRELTKEEQKKLLEEYQTLIKNYQNNTCADDIVC